MMIPDTFPISHIKPADFPPLLHQLPAAEIPLTLNYRGQLPAPDLKLIAVVGSRRYTNYGKQVVESLLAGLANYPIGIVSGLALGIDSLAHQAALRENLYTLAVPGSGLEDAVIYPRTHRTLARSILAAGGGLLSEFEPNTSAAPWTFPQRNRLMAGLTHATLMIEAGEKSGTLITARLCVDYNRELLAVPGSIFSANSAGTHQFLKLGATLVSEAADIIEALGLQAAEQSEAAPRSALLPAAQRLYDLLTEPKTRDQLIQESGLSAEETSATLMQMVLSGHLTSSYDSFARTPTT